MSLSEKSLGEYLDKKVEPATLIKSIGDLQRKTAMINVPDIYKVSYMKLGQFDKNSAHLNKISELDKRIANLDRELTKKLNVANNN